MARVIPTVAANSATGLVLALAAANADGDAVVNNGRKILHVKNGSASSINVTVLRPVAATPGGIPLANLVYAIAAGAEAEIGPWGSEWHQPNGEVWIDYSAVTTVTRQVREMPRVM
ncbi:hypothetical protein [Actinokineospora sp.]|uniref:hypothetical protein n=1 Tax=Actinokineospora sp. TaxID=1872133 RepID=UPI003D6C1E14